MLDNNNYEALFLYKERIDEFQFSVASKIVHCIFSDSNGMVHVPCAFSLNELSGVVSLDKPYQRIFVKFNWVNVVVKNGTLFQAH